MTNINDARRELARQIYAHLRLFCTRIEIAGAIRRGSLTVRDIDIVCEPAWEGVNDLFGNPVQTMFQFEGAVLTLCSVCALAPVKSGERYRQFRSEALDCNVDLFVVKPPASWGAILAIRTGPADFSHRLVSSRFDGGAMPFGMQQKDGALWRNGERLETPTEESWFEALGVPCWNPVDRTEKKLIDYLERKRAQRW